MNDLIGRRIGPYEIKNLIGQGGMARFTAPTSPR